MVATACERPVATLVLASQATYRWATGELQNSGRGLPLLIGLVHMLFGQQCEQALGHAECETRPPRAPPTNTVPLPFEPRHANQVSPHKTPSSWARQRPRQAACDIGCMSERAHTHACPPERTYRNSFQEELLRRTRVEPVCVPSACPNNAWKHRSCATRKCLPFHPRTSTTASCTHTHMPHLRCWLQWPWHVDQES